LKNSIWVLKHSILNFSPQIEFSLPIRPSLFENTLSDFFNLVYLIFLNYSMTTSWVFWYTLLTNIYFLFSFNIFLFFLYFIFFSFFLIFCLFGTSKWVTTDALSLQYLRSNDLLSTLCSKFVKTNELFFKTNLLKALSSVDLKLYLHNSSLIQNYDPTVYSSVNLKS